MAQATRKKPVQKKRKQAAEVYDVLCRQCRGVFYETTEHFDPDRSPNTSMCRLKEPYKAWCWDDFHTPPPGEGTGPMECPQCGAPYIDESNRLTIDVRKAA